MFRSVHTYMNTRMHTYTNQTIQIRITNKVQIMCVYVVCLCVHT